MIGGVIGLVIVSIVLTLVLVGGGGGGDDTDAQSIEGHEPDDLADRFNVQDRGDESRVLHVHDDGYRWGASCGEKPEEIDESPRSGANVGLDCPSDDVEIWVTDGEKDMQVK